jgi:hypothetical protein
MEPLGRRRLPLWLKVGWTAWVLVWIPNYWDWYGPQNFLWFCDIANLAIAAALWMESSLLFSWQAVSVLAFQLAWTVEVAWRAAFGVHLVGGTEYMWDAGIPLRVRMLSLFHAAMPPLLLWALRRLGYDRRALAAQTATAWVVLPICYFAFGPGANLNWVWGPFDKPQSAVAPFLYFVGCMAAHPLLVYAPTHVFLLRVWPGPKPGQ